MFYVLKMWEILVREKPISEIGKFMGVNQNRSMLSDHEREILLTASSSIHLS